MPNNVLAEGIWLAELPGMDVVENAASITQAHSAQQLLDAVDRVYGEMAEHSRTDAGNLDVTAVACSYIEQNLTDQNLNVAAICEAAGVSVKRLTPPTEYRRMLTSGNDQV